MITALLANLQAQARIATCAARAVLRGGMLALIAGLAGLAGAGLLVFAAYTGLRPVFGPALAALATGVVLLLLAALAADRSGLPSLLRTPPAPADRSPLPASAPIPPESLSVPAATMAVFTAAFVLGRSIADRRRR